MQHLLVLYIDEAAFPKLTPPQQEQRTAAYRAYRQALIEAGAFVGSNRLRPTSSATVVSIRNGKTHVQDGPYSDSKEQLAGYFLIDVPDLHAALEWAARCPTASHGTVEVRPIWPVDAASGTYEH
jgi:hypothetical protein